MAAGTVEVSGLALAYDEQGAGPAALLVHGPGIAAPLWAETLAALRSAELRAIAYDRRGYGRSEAPEPYAGTTVEEQAGDAAALLGSLAAAPAVVCGHDLGALVALDLARRHPALVRGMVLVEPPLLFLSPAGPEAMSELREAIEAGAREGGAGGAVDAYLRHVGGAAALARLGPQRTAAARSAARSFAADLGAAPAYALGRRELRALRAPAVVVAAAGGAPERRQAAEALAALLPAAELRVAAGRHLVPVEDPQAVAAAVLGLAGR